VKPEMKTVDLIDSDDDVALSRAYHAGPQGDAESQIYWVNLGVIQMGEIREININGQSQSFKMLQVGCRNMHN